MSMQAKKQILELLVAAMMAVDLGGPFNKAYSHHGLSSNYDHGGRMAGGMAPACSGACRYILWEDLRMRKESVD